MKIASVGAAPYCVFVGKLEKETSEDDLMDFLTDNGIGEAEVRKLEAKEKWQEKSAAFRVAVPNKYKDVLMNPDIWPDYVEVRDWVYKSKAST
jgi:hypothetical protein